MENTSKKNIDQVSSSKRSIMLRWAFANTVFCFITFTIFAALIYQMTVTTILNGEKDSMITAMNGIEESLTQSEVKLSINNLHNYLEYSVVPQIQTESGEGGIEPQSLGSMIGNRKSFFIYDTEGQLIYATSHHTFALQGKDDNVITEYSGQYPGFLSERRIVSKETGKTIGYLQSFYNTSFYNNIRNKLLISLIILEVLALIIAQFVGYFMASRYMRPLEILHMAMLKISKNPTEEYQPVEIKTGDEIEELADVYNDMMKKMANYVEQQKRFVSDVSHELRTPLAVIDGHLNLLNRWGKDDPEVLEESIAASIEETSRMKSMLEEMLALSRLQTIQDDYRNFVTDAVASCQHLVKNFKLVNEDLDIACENRLPNPTIQIYENHYEQALTILIDNAIKYSPKDRQNVRIILTEDDDFIYTAVKDKGFGISKEDVGHVFERFFRADKARNRDIGGTGLGLSIISRIVENYNGEINVESEFGEGSTFTMKFPKAKEMA